MLTEVNGFLLAETSRNITKEESWNSSLYTQDPLKSLIAWGWKDCSVVRALVPEDPDSISSTHEQLIPVCSCSSRDPTYSHGYMQVKHQST